MTHTKLEYVLGKVLTYVLGKAITYPSVKDNECKEFNDKNPAPFEQVKRTSLISAADYRLASLPF